MHLKVIGQNQIELKGRFCRPKGSESACFPKNLLSGLQRIRSFCRMIMKKTIFFATKMALQVLIIFSLTPAFAQVALVNSPYQQNFNSLGDGLPTGWSVRTGATATLAGTTATFVTAATSWSSTSGNFRNVASATDLNSASSTTDQGNSINRALGLRQTSSFGDNGGAFTLQLANTSGKTGFSISFRMQSLDNTSPRLTSWQVQYATGASPASFTTVATIPANFTTGSNSFSNQDISANFASSLDNINDIVWIRVVTLSGTTGSGNRPTSAIDDVSLVWTAAGAPGISPSVAALAFDPAAIGTPSPAKTYTVTGTALTENLNLSVTGPFQVSKDGANYFTNLSYSPAEAAASPTVSVRVVAAAAGLLSGNIQHTSTGVTTRNVALSGEGFDPSSLSATFNTCTQGGAPGNNFTTFSVTGAQLWQCTSFGRNGSNGVQINGFSGSAQDNEDWLISPAFNLSSFNVPVLSFYSLSTFIGPALEVLVSTNYSGSGSPAAATWQPLPVLLPVTGSNAWQMSDNIILSAYKTAGVYIAFKYKSSPAAGASRWTVDDFEIRNASSAVFATPATLDFGEMAAGSTSAAKLVFMKAAGIGNVQVSVPAPYEISADNVTYSASLTITEVNALTGSIFFVRVKPLQRLLTLTGNIRFQGTGFDENRVAMTVSSMPKTETLEVAAYNMLFFGNTVTADGPADKTLQRQNIAAAINAMQPDIIAVEEISGEAAMNALMTDLGNNYSYVLSPRWSYSFDGPDPTFPPQKVGFIYRKSAVTLLNTRPMFEQMYDVARAGGNTPLNSYPTGTPSSFYASGRLPFMADFSVTLAGKTKQIRAVVIHGKSGGSDIMDWQRRSFDSKALKDTLDAWYSTDPVIILGDFNDKLGSSINAGQQSSYKNFMDDVTNYRGLTLPAELAGAVTFLGIGGSMIDHIMVSNDWFSEYIETTAGAVDLRPLIPSYASTTSDHLPVLARFDLKQETILPVRLISFNGKTHTEGIRLDWLTTHEVNVDYFDIERSDNGQDFGKLAKVSARGGSNQPQSYNMVDATPLKGMNYYRLKMADRDGKFSYSPIIQVENRMMDFTGISISPNPATGGQINLKLPADVSNGNLQVFSPDGKLVGFASGNARTLSEALTQTARKLPGGIYQVVVSDGKQRYNTRLLLSR